MSENKMFYRLNEEGNAMIFHQSGEAVTQIDANVYPINSELSTRYEHPEGIVLSIEDAKRLGINPEYQDIIKIRIDAKTFIESLTKEDDGSVQLDEGIVSAYVADLLNNAGIEAEARYQDTDWSIEIKGKKYYSSMSFYDKPEEGLLSAIRYFADEVNSGNDFESWYSYSKGEHFLNLRQKEPGTEPKEA